MRCTNLILLCTALSCTIHIAWKMCAALFFIAFFSHWMAETSSNFYFYIGFLWIWSPFDEKKKPFHPILIQCNFYGHWYFSIIYISYFWFLFTVSSTRRILKWFAHVQKFNINRNSFKADKKRDIHLCNSIVNVKRESNAQRIVQLFLTYVGVRVLIAYVAQF